MINPATFLLRFLSSDLKKLVFFQTFVERLTLFALPIYIYAETQSSKMLGIAVVLEWLPTIVVLPFAGKLVDKLGSKVAMTYASVFRCLVVFALIVLLSHSSVVALLLLAAIFSSAGNILAYLGFEKYVSTSVDANEVQSHYSFFALSQQINFLVAPLVGAIVVGAIGPQLFFLVYAVLFALIFLYSARFLAPDLVKPETKRSFGFLETLGALVENRLLLRLAVCMFSINMLLAIYMTLIPAAIIGKYGLTENAIAALYFVSALLSAVFHALFTWGRFSRSMKLLGSITPLLIPAVILVMILDDMAVYFVVGVLAMALSLPFAVWSRTRRNSLLPPDNFATSASLIMVLSLLGYPVGGAVVAILPKVDVNYLLPATAALVLVVSSVLLQNGDLWSKRAPDR